MTTYNNKKEKNWTLICCIGFSALVVSYMAATTRISTVTEQYRKELLVQYMQENDNLQKNQCDIPAAKAVSEAVSKGIKTDLHEAKEYLDVEGKDRCEQAVAKISENQDKMAKLVYVKAPMSYITDHIFN